MRELVAALDQEIDTMQHLDHVNIVQYLGCERKESSISIFLEYIPGGSIGSCLRKHGKFEESVVSSSRDRRCLAWPICIARASCIVISKPTISSSI